MPVLMLHPRETKALWSQNYDTRDTIIQQCKAVKGVDNNAMACHRSGYDRHRHAQASSVRADSSCYLQGVSWSKRSREPHML